MNNKTTEISHNSQTENHTSSVVAQEMVTIQSKDSGDIKNMSLI
jgi:hypothetical protein